MDTSKVTKVFFGAKGDAELVVMLLNRWHSSRCSHPAVANEAEAVADAFQRHSDESHLSDFETCDDLACRLALMLEQAYGWIDDDLSTYNEERQ